MVSNLLLKLITTTKFEGGNLNEKQHREELVNGMKQLTQDGFKCFVLKENQSYMYGFMVTPNDKCIIYSAWYILNGGSWTVTMYHKPSQKNGQGCQCLEEPFNEITTDIYFTSRTSNDWRSVRRLKAESYKTVMNFLIRDYSFNISYKNTCNTCLLLI